jgi:hypothetical protein
MVIRSRKLRPNRSSLHTVNVSPGFRVLISGAGQGALWSRRIFHHP